MKATLLDTNGKTKRYTIEHEGKSLVLALAAWGNGSKQRVMPRYIIHNGTKYIAWQKEYGSFLNLVKKCIGLEVKTTRQAFLDKLYWGEE